jgi:alanine dehydrogenase
VPHTSTYALTNATLPYVLALAEWGALAAVTRDAALRTGVNIVAGRVTNPAVAEALGVPALDPLVALAG